MSNKILSIAFYTFKEIMKSKILYGMILLGLFMMLSVYVASEFTYGAPERVAVDVGLGLLSLSSIGIALFLGVTLLSKEIDSRTVYMVISRPVNRYQFILGKLLGLIGVLLLNILLLSSMTLMITSIVGGKFSELVYWSIFFNFLESLVLLLLVLFFSLITNTILSAIYAFVLLVIGHVIADTQNILFVQNRPFLGTILKAYHFVLPGFYKLNIKDFVLYHQKLETSYLINSSLYGLCYSGFLLFMIIFIFNRKNLD